MFGLVTASVKELGKEELRRYNGVYCGICRGIRAQHGQLSRMTLSYDMAFLALLLMSLYEPAEEKGSRACGLHPVKPKPWIDNDCIRYAADMNVALAYYKALDDWNDDRSYKAKAAAKVLGENLDQIRQRYPRQCRAIEDCIARLSQLEGEECANPDLGANCFGELMAELLVWKQDLWEPHLRLMGHYLGRFIYLADAAVDYRGDKKKNKYNPFLAMGCGEDWAGWEDYLVQAMGRCTQEFEKLPLVQDKALLDNILYSGVWVNYRGKGAKVREET